MKLLIANILIITISLFGCSKIKNQRTNIIPEPFFTLKQENAIHLDSTNLVVQNIAHYLIAKLSKPTGFNFTTDNNLEENSGFFLKLDNTLDSLGQEGYVLKVEKDKIVITAFKANGLFYGIQS